MASVVSIATLHLWRMLSKMATTQNFDAVLSAGNDYCNCYENSIDLLIPFTAIYFGMTRCTALRPCHGQTGRSRSVRPNLTQAIGEHSQRSVSEVAGSLVFCIVGSGGPVHWHRRLLVSYGRFGGQYHKSNYCMHNLKVCSLSHRRVVKLHKWQNHLPQY